jgi:anaerobic magnesium-protoporphyrin IX monomethyl ester cyclase
MSDVVLIGSEFEENLSIRYLAAAVERAGYRAELVAFNEDDRWAEIVHQIADLSPLVLGISVPFQMRAASLLGLADHLRVRGVPSHITAGGHFVTFEWPNVLADYPAIDSVVRHEGEEAFVELCERVRYGRSPTGIPGVVARNGNGGVVDGGPRKLPPLDALPFPDRRGAPHTVMGVRTSPIVGSRGCYADCSFCCIYAYADSADGARYRMRSPEDIVAEMEEEYHQRNVRLFIFHDDNFFVPSEKKNLTRYGRMRDLLDEAGLTDIAIVIKCRPNDVTPELFRLLKSMGVIRAYVGIETNSDEGIVSLNRRITSEDNRRALNVLKELDVYCSFNVLIFDPEATMEGVLRNLDFMEAFADVPFNFCRAEVYAGTPLKSVLEHQGRLRGNYMAWGYEMRQPRVELLFRIASTAFHTRNFKTDGVHNLNLGIRFDNEVMRRFYPECWDPSWHHRLVDLSGRIGRDGMALMRRAHAFVAHCDLNDHEAIKTFAVDLARTVARADLAFVTEIKACRREMEQRIADRAGVRAAKTDYDQGRPVWAAESHRLASSVGKELSTEVLPEPTRLGAREVRR